MRIGGYTNHLSDWAILIDINENLETDSNSSNSSDYSEVPIYVWPIVAVSGILVIAGITAAIVIKRKQRREEEEALNQNLSEEKGLEL